MPVEFGEGDQPSSGTELDADVFECNTGHGAYRSLGESPAPPDVRHDTDGKRITACWEKIWSTRVHPVRGQASHLSMLVVPRELHQAGHGMADTVGGINNDIGHPRWPSALPPKRHGPCSTWIGLGPTS